MDLGLTTQQKMSALAVSKVGIQSEIYNLLVRMSIDPDTFDPNVDMENNDSFVGEQTRLRYLLDSLALIESKLAELG